MIDHQYIGVKAVGIAILYVSFDLGQPFTSIDRSFQSSMVAVEKLTVDFVAKLSREWEVEPFRRLLTDRHV